jgi:hypothetical protein
MSQGDSAISTLLMSSAALRVTGALALLVVLWLGVGWALQ